MAERAYIAFELESGRIAPPGLHLVHSGSSTAQPTVKRSPREVAGLTLLSVLLHAGVALGFYRGDAQPNARRASKVDIEFARLPDPPRPKLAPPPPPPLPKLEKQAPPSPALQAPTPRPIEAPPISTEVSEPAQADTGSRAEAADDGNLFAGRGGSGVRAPAPAPAPPVPIVSPQPAPVVAAHEGANYSKNPRPGYPARARREGWQGEVLVRVQVLPNGRAGLLKIQKSAGFPALDEAALAAIRGWSFVPAKQGGQPVSGWVTVPIVFRLQ